MTARARKGLPRGAAGRAIAVGGAVVLSVPLLAAPAGADSAQPNDITGDGRGELVVGSPEGTANGIAGSGSVSVAFGSAKGVDTTKNRLVTQSSPGVPGTPEKGDRFGAQTATGDLDGDGYADLIVSAPGEDVGVYPDAGLVQIIFGSASGPSGRAVSIEAPHQEDAVWRFGSSLTVGDYNDDGLSDLVIGSSGYVLSVLYGSTALGSGAPVLDELALDVDNVAALASGEVDGAVNADNYSDLVVSAPGYDGKDGLVKTFRGSPDGLSDTPWGGSVQQYEVPPKRIAVGDVDGDGYAELAVGATDDQLPTLFRGGPDGFVESESVALGTGTPSAGGDVWIDDVNVDGYADVAVGRPSRLTDDGGRDARGTASLYWGGADLVSASRVQNFAQGSGGVPGAAEDGDLFGATIAVNEFNGGTSRRDLVIAAIGENGHAGAVTVLYGGKGAGDPVSTVGAQTFGGATLGHAGTKGFGTAIAGLPRPS